ncbi:hypothetical protein ACSBR2_009209 [Camellia fascicularis]
MLDQIQKLVELNSTNDIGSVVNNLPLKWVATKGRTSVGIGKTSSTLALPSSAKSNAVAHKRNQKRKRLSWLR